MVASLPDLRAALFAGLLLLPALVQSASPRAADRSVLRSDEYQLDGRDLRIDSRASQMRINDVTITQGGIRVHASEAMAQGEKQSFNNSRWEFRGDVSIQFQDGSLTAETTTVTIVGNRIVRAVAAGKPATFVHKVPSMSRPVSGRSNGIDYDVPANRIKLSGGVQFSDGRNESTMQALVYDLATRVWESDNAPGDSGRVQMTIRPNETVTTEAPPPAATP